MHRRTTLALTLLSVVILTSAGTPADTPVPAALRTAEPLPLVETPESDGVATQLASCGGAESEGALFAPVDVEASDFTPTDPTARPKRGFCQCGCSFTPDCATDADCGWGRCLRGPTCC